jgi:hypothetical protein
MGRCAIFTGQNSTHTFEKFALSMGMSLSEYGIKKMEN